MSNKKNKKNQVVSTVSEVSQAVFAGMPDEEPETEVMEETEVIEASTSETSAPASEADTTPDTVPEQTDLDSLPEFSFATVDENDEALKNEILSFAKTTKNPKGRPDTLYTVSGLKITPLIVALNIPTTAARNAKDAPITAGSPGGKAQLASVMRTLAKIGAKLGFEVMPAAKVIDHSTPAGERYQLHYKVDADRATKPTIRQKYDCAGHVRIFLRFFIAILPLALDDAIKTALIGTPARLHSAWGEPTALIPMPTTRGDEPFRNAFPPLLHKALEEEGFRQAFCIHGRLASTGQLDRKASKIIATPTTIKGGLSPLDTMQLYKAV